MKKNVFSMLIGIVALVFLLLLSACSNHTQQPSNESDDLTSESVSSQESVSSSTAEDTSVSQTEIQFFSSLDEVPYANFTFSEDRSSLLRDGEPYCGLSVAFELGDHFFSDGKVMCIQAMVRNEPASFRWFVFRLEKEEGEESDGWTFLPEETYNCLFVRAQGNVVYTDDGYSYTLLQGGWAPLNFTKFLNFLNESQILSFLTPDLFNRISQGETPPAQEVYEILARSLCVWAQENKIALQVNADGVPYFSFEDFVCAAWELLGITYDTADFQKLAEQSEYKAPNGMLCAVKSELPTSYIASNYMPRTDYSCMGYNDDGEYCYTFGYELQSENKVQYQEIYFYSNYNHELAPFCFYNLSIYDR